MAGRVMLPENIPRLDVTSSQSLRRSGGRRSASACRSSQSLRLSRESRTSSGPRTPKGTRLPHTARTPRGKRATRWLKGRRDATFRLAHRSANVATNKISSAFHMSPRQERHASPYSHASANESASSREDPREGQVTQTTSDRPTLHSDCGFASASLLPVSGPSEFEVRVTAIDAALTNEGLAKMFDFADTVLYREDLSGFEMVVDLRKVRFPKMSLVSEVKHWSKDAQRRKAFQERCRGLTVCVPSGLKFRLAKSTMSMFFKQCPLSGPTYLVTSLEEGKSETTVTFGGASSAGTARGPKTASHTSAEGTVQSANLEFTPIARSRLLDMFVDMCEGCFDFLGVIASGCSGSGPQRLDGDTREVVELKRTVDELSTRIEQLESEKRRKYGIRKSIGLR